MPETENSMPKSSPKPEKRSELVQSSCHQEVEEIKSKQNFKKVSSPEKRIVLSMKSPLMSEGKVQNVSRALKYREP